MSMMRVAVMQPYLFPYIGYFQLMHYTEKFFLLDNVNYIKKGWINRNNIVVNHQPYRFTLPLREVSQHKKINEIGIGADEKWKKNFLETLRVAYQHAPFYDEAAKVIRSIILHDNKHLSGFLSNSLEVLADYIDIKTEIIPVSSVGERAGLKGQERIIDLCVRAKATEYINLPGGKGLYESAAFSEHDVRLAFIEPKLSPYPQQQNSGFLAGLSIIDVLMNNSVESVQQLVSDYTIVSA
jgi:hypothetical protein